MVSKMKQNLRLNGFQMVASPSTQSVSFCLTDAELASREESEQPSMTNYDRGTCINRLLGPVYCTTFQLFGEETPQGLTAQILFT